MGGSLGCHEPEVPSPPKRGDLITEKPVCMDLCISRTACKLECSVAGGERKIGIRSSSGMIVVRGGRNIFQ